MAWTSAKHPRSPIGEFAAAGAAPASSQTAKQKPKPKAQKRAMKPVAARKVRSGGKRRSVTVKRGDTLSGIARRSHESLAQLKKDNPGLFSKRHRGGNLIFPGNKVKLAARPKPKSKARARPKAQTATLKKAPKPKAAPKVRSTTTKKAAAPKAKAAPTRAPMARSTRTGARRSSTRVVSKGGGYQFARR